MTKIIRNHHVLAVPDKKASADFFIGIMGFKKFFEDEGWIFVVKDNCWIMLGECPDAMHPTELGDHSYFAYFAVDDADLYFEEVKARGAEIISQISDKPWNMREFGLRTPDGYRIMVGHEINGSEK